MVFSKNFLVVLLVLSTISLCLARPRWEFIDEDEKDDYDDGNWKDEVSAREAGKNEESVMKKWKKGLKCDPHDQPAQVLARKAGKNGKSTKKGGDNGSCKIYPGRPYCTK